MDNLNNELSNKSQKQLPSLEDIINCLRFVNRFNLEHYREGEYGIVTEVRHNSNGDYIYSYEIDDIILKLESLNKLTIN